MASSCEACVLAYAMLSTGYLILLVHVLTGGSH